MIKKLKCKDGQVKTTKSNMMIIFLKILMTLSMILTVAMRTYLSNKKNTYFSTFVHIIVMDREESSFKAIQTIKMIKKKKLRKNKWFKKQRLD